MTRICVSIAERTTAAVIDRLAELAPLADLFEVRADWVADLDLAEVLRARTKPLLFTCRSAAEGGQWNGTEAARCAVLMEAVRRGFDYVDVEYRADFSEVARAKSGSGLVLSFHDLEGTPLDLHGLYGDMSDRGADIVKIAVTPRSVADVGRLLALAERAKREGGPPLVAIAMGSLGFISRVVGGRYDAPFTYASVAKGSEVAPGQIPAAALADVYRVRAVSPSTKVYGILGTDVTRSLSPAIHNGGFAARQIDAVYVPLQAEALEPFVAALPSLCLAGFSVTRPFKTAIIKHLHGIEEAAAVCGSVNTVVVQDGDLVGSTTDGAGVTVPLRRLIDIRGKLVVILGAGGAARAAAVALRARGARVTVFAREEAKAAAMAAAVGCAHGSLSDLEHRTWDVLINATPVGSSALAGETPLPAEWHKPGSVVFDMVYDPLETRLLREAKAAGCQTLGGIDMLLAQAVGQFETWTGVEAPIDAMTSAVLAAVGEGA